MTTVSLLLFYRLLQLFTIIYAQSQILPSPNGWAFLSQIIRIIFMFMFPTLQHLRTTGTTVAFPSDVWHACSRRCQLALDLNVRGTGYTHPALSERLQYGWCLSIVVFKLLLSRKPFLQSFQWNCDFLLSFCWQKGDHPDNDLRWAMQHPDKKTFLPSFCDLFLLSFAFLTSHIFDLFPLLPLLPGTNATDYRRYSKGRWA